LRLLDFEINDSSLFVLRRAHSFYFKNECCDKFCYTPGDMNLPKISALVYVSLNLAHIALKQILLQRTFVLKDRNVLRDFL